LSVGITYIVEGLLGVVKLLASEGTSLLGACLELIVVGPFTVDFAWPFVESAVDRDPQKSFANLILSMFQSCGSWPIGFPSLCYSLAVVVVAFEPEGGVGSVLETPSDLLLAFSSTSPSLKGKITKC
jgi:hypothetical protein